MSFPFDAVLFDLDGTLLATDRFWIPAARVGAKRAFAELGLERALPGGEEWMALVGLPLAEGFDQLFADLEPEQRALVLARCVEEEHFALKAGKAALLPGVRDALDELRARGVRMGIASNCSQPYLDAALSDVGLSEWIAEARCLDSPGIETKADMIQDLLWTFGTRSAVFVGDRATDARAAHANALPHVHLESGFAPAGEEVEREAAIHDFLELIPRLEGRRRWIENALGALGVGAASRVVGVTGRRGAGKTLFARDAARLLCRRGVQATALDLDALEIGPPLDGDPSGYYGALRERLGEVAGVALVDGPFLWGPGAREVFDALVYLDVPEELCLARLRARLLPLGERELFEGLRDRWLPAERRMEGRFPPEEVADLVLDAGNPLGPG